MCFSVFDEEKEKEISILKNVNLNVNSGEFLVILGKNGSGKSTLIKQLNGVLLPTSGDVLVNGINTKDEERICEIRQKIGMVFQNPDNQIVSSLVEEDVAFGPENLGFSRNKILESVEKALKVVDAYDLKNFSVDMLSGGQKQRIAIAGVLAMDPECIILDEPTSMLDPKGRNEVLSTIVKLNKENSTTIILITHNVEEIFFSDRVIIMDSGKLVFNKKPKEILSNLEYAEALGISTSQVLDLVRRLNEKGFSFPIVTSEEECAENISKVLGGVVCR